MNPAVERNLGFISEFEQQQLGRAVVAVSGAGGDGGGVALSLARMGVGADGGEIRIADPDVFETQNLNRQVCCTTKTVGMNKAEVVGAYIRDINPAITVTVFNEGVTVANIPQFLNGATLLVDETEYTIPHLAVALARQARARSIPNLQVLNVGFGAQVTTYNATSPYTLEKRLGITEGIDVEQQTVPLVNWLADLPMYLDLGMFERLAREEISAPSVVSGVGIASSIAAVQAFLLITGGSNKRPRPVYAPRVFSVDAMTGTARIIRYTKLRVRMSLLQLIVRSKLGLVPEVVVA